MIGHRGASETCPENTIAAVREAVRRSDGFKCDLQLLNDGTLIVLHDTTLYRTAGGAWWHYIVAPRLAWALTTPVSQLSWSDVRDIDVGSTFDSKFSSERVPTFAEILVELKGKHCFAELKVDPGRRLAIARAAAQEIDHSITRLTWISFDLEILLDVKQLTQRPAFLVVQVHTASDAMDAAKIVIESNLDGLDLNADLTVVTPILVDFLHSRNKQIAVWVSAGPNASNDTLEIRRVMANRGVDFFTSNLPPLVGDDDSKDVSPGR